MNMWRIKKASWIHVFSLVVMGAGLTGCGGNGGVLIGGATARVYLVDGDQWVEGRVNIVPDSSIVFPSVSLPIAPNGEVIGNVSVGTNVNGGGFLAVAINYTKALQLPSGGAVLPNGLPVPLGASGEVPIIGIPVGGAGSQVYVAYGPNVAMLGAAIVIPALDVIGANIGSTVLMPAFRFGNVSGIAGLFTSRTSYQNGLGLFLNLNELIHQPGGIGGGLAMSIAKSLTPNVQGRGTLRYEDAMPSVSKRNQAWRQIDRLRSQGAVLRAR